MTTVHVRQYYLEYLGDSLELPLGETLVGRDFGCMLRFNDPSVSRRHVRFLRRNTEVVVEDMRSSNGTLLNGERLRNARVLREGDVLTIGSRELTLRVADGEDTQPSTLVFDEPGAVTARRAQLPTVPPLYRSDRRRDARHCVELTVHYVSSELELEASSRDLSTHGVFVCTQVLDPVGTPCTLKLVVGSGAPLELTGVVRRVVDQPGEGEAVGLGVEFLGINAPDLAWLDVVIDRVIDLQLPSLP